MKDSFCRGDIVRTKVSLLRRLIPMRTHSGGWVWIPKWVIIHCYLPQMMAWECWADGQQWFFDEKKLEKWESKMDPRDNKHYCIECGVELPVGVFVHCADCIDCLAHLAVPTEVQPISED